MGAVKKATNSVSSALGTDGGSGGVFGKTNRTNISIAAKALNPPELNAAKALQEARDAAAKALQDARFAAALSAAKAVAAAKSGLTNTTNGAANSFSSALGTDGGYGGFFGRTNFDNAKAAAAKAEQYFKYAAAKAEADARAAAAKAEADARQAAAKAEADAKSGLTNTTNGAANSFSSALGTDGGYGGVFGRTNMRSISNGAADFERRTREAAAKAEEDAKAAATKAAEDLRLKEIADAAAKAEQDAKNAAAKAEQDAREEAQRTSTESISKAFKDAAAHAQNAWADLKRSTTTELGNAGNALGNAGANIEAGLNAESANMGNLNLSASWNKLGTGIGEAGAKLETGVNTSAQRLDQGAKNWTSDPMKELKGAAKEVAGASLVPFTPTVNALSRWTGGTGNGFGDLGVGEEYTNQTKTSTSAAVDATKALAASALMMTPVTAGAGALIGADLTSKYSGGSGNSLKDVGANGNWETVGRLAATTSGYQAPTSLGSNASTVEKIANAAGNGATNGMLATTTMNPHATGEEIAIAGATGALAAGSGNVTGGQTATERVINSATRGAVGQGTAAAATGKSAEEIIKAAGYGAVASGGATAIGEVTNVGKLTNAKGEQDYAKSNYTNGVTEADWNNGNYHTLGEDVVTKNSSNLNWNQPTESIVGGAWSGGFNAAGQGGEWKDGARVGAAGGAAGYTAQLIAGALNGGDLVQAGANTLGTVAGQVVETGKIMKEKGYGMLNAPEFTANFQGKEGGLNPNLNVTYENARKKNSGYHRT